MMCMGNLKGLFAFTHATLLLALSFFVLFAVRKLEAQGLLKAFGNIVAVFLWIAAALVLSVGISTFGIGRHPMMGRMQEMMKDKKSGMMPGQKQEMMKGAMPAMPQEKHK